MTKEKRKSKSVTRKYRKKNKMVILRSYKYRIVIRPASDQLFDLLCLWLTLLKSAPPPSAPYLQSVCLVKCIERIQQHATKSILSLPFIGEISYKERLASWQEYLDQVFFFEAFTGMISMFRNTIPVY